MVVVASLYCLLRDGGGAIKVECVGMGFLCLSWTLILCYIFVLNTEIELDARLYV